MRAQQFNRRANFLNNVWAYTDAHPAEIATALREQQEA
jgi:hypothetical protein